MYIDIDHMYDHITIFHIYLSIYLIASVNLHDPRILVLFSTFVARVLGVKLAVASWAAVAGALEGKKWETYNLPCLYIYMYVYNSMYVHIYIYTVIYIYTCSIIY